MKSSCLYMIALTLACACGAAAEEQPTDEKATETTATTEAEPDCDEHAVTGLLDDLLLR